LGISMGWFLCFPQGLSWFLRRCLSLLLECHLTWLWVRADATQGYFLGLVRVRWSTWLYPPQLCQAADLLSHSHCSLRSWPQLPTPQPPVWDALLVPHGRYAGHCPHPPLGAKRSMPLDPVFCMVLSESRRWGLESFQVGTGTPRD
jgi:hypothetical protein